MHGRQERGYRVLVGRKEVKKPLGRLRCRRKSNIKIYFEELNGRIE